MVYTLQEWLGLDDQEMVRIVEEQVSTVVIYLNGTRRWFLSQNEDWSNYARVTGAAQRALSQLFFDHGIQTLIQPLMGYDLLPRGYDYMKLAVEQGLVELASKDYRDWYRRAEIRLNLYGNWSAALTEMGFSEVVELLNELVEETSYNSKHRLLLGLFADHELDHIVLLTRNIDRGEELLKRYYGQVGVRPIDIIIGSGQPAIWDLPLLNVNKASLYFLQAPTFCLNKQILRHILYDHLYHRVNDDQLYDNLTEQEWQDIKVLGIGQRTQKGWIAV